MKLLICEKPSQARDIARVIGAGGRRENYLEGNGYRVTWCVGHLLEQAPPEAYRPDLKPWRVAKLPVVPERWRLLPKPRSRAQLATVRKLLAQASDVIIATDADREGELIAREVLELAGYRGRIERLWLSALDDASIRKAFAALRPGAATEHLYYAGLGRQRADWLVGMNLTMAASALFSPPGAGALSVGRVQTPTLKLVVDRDLAIEAFVPKDYFVVRALFGAGERAVWTRWEVPEAAQGDEEGRCLERRLAEAVVAKVQGARGSVVEYRETAKKQPPPPCLSLSALQKKASARWGMGAKRVLEVAQSLYETHKATTYPRSDCGYLPQSQFAEAPEVLAALGGIDPELAPLLARCDSGRRSPVWNDRKVTAHHAIIPTRNTRVDPSRMSQDERRLYDLIRRYYIAQFLGDHTYVATRLAIACAGERFVAAGRRTTGNGWKEAFGIGPEAAGEGDEEETTPVPRFTKGEAVDNREAGVEAKRTTPPPRFTEGTLIEAMKSVGRLVQDPRLKAVLKETAGIGTEATRSNIIETLFTRDYLTRQGKQVLSTPKGRALIATVPDIIKDPATTARWEQALDEVADGRMALADFLRGQTEALGAMIAALQQAREQGGVPFPAAAAAAPAGQAQHACPDCGKPLARRKGKQKGFFWGCTGYPACRTVLPDSRGRPGKRRAGKGGRAAKAAAKGPAATAAPAASGESRACPACGAPMRLRENRQDGSRFWGCSGYPACKTTLPQRDGGAAAPADAPPCPQCGKGRLRRIEGRRGAFWGCSNFRDGCKFTCDDAGGRPQLAASDAAR